LTCEKDSLYGISPSKRAHIVSTSFPLFKLGSSYIQYVDKFKYLGHIIDQHLSDDNDVLREVVC